MKTLIRYTKINTEVGVRLLGVINNDERFEDGHRIFTSVVVEEYTEDTKNYAKTETGSVYELGDELKLYEFYNMEKDKGSNQGVETMKFIIMTQGGVNNGDN